MRSHLPIEKNCCQLEDELELGKLHSVGFPARDDDDTTTRLVAVRIKGHVQEMESMGLDDQLDD